MKRNIVITSLVAAMFLTIGAHSAQIIGADPADVFEANKQYGFGGFNLDNVDVKITDLDYNEIDGMLFYSDGTYDAMGMGETFESDIFSIGDDKTDPATRMAYLHQKNWPLSEPTGIKVINNDNEVSNGKPKNCIMASSYLIDSNLDTGTPPQPVICSSPAGSNKRLSLLMGPNMVAGANPGEYGHYVDLVFNIDPKTAGGDHRYQVFQKINNYTGMRLDGYTLKVLNENGDEDKGLTLSLGEGEERDKDNILTGGDLWPEYEYAFYPPGLWGGEFGVKDHLEPGWFDLKASGFHVSGHGTNTLTSGARLGGNYVELFGTWLPGKWVPLGMHEVRDPLEEPVLIAFWGTTPEEAGDVNAIPDWHYGMDHDLSDGDQSWVSPTQEELVMWASNPDKYVVDVIEDAPNISLNYIVNVGESISNKFIIRLTPHVAVDQTPPSYIEDDNVTYILPPTSYTSTLGIVTISPEPTFTPGTNLSVGVADADLNENATQIDEVTITVKSDTGDSETVKLTETGVDSGVFSATLPTENSASTPTANNGVMTVVEGTVVTATYVDIHYGVSGVVKTLTASTSAQTPVVDDGNDAVDSEGNPASSGGGCSYNPNSKNFDMMFLLIAGLGLLFPLRRRFLK